MQCFVVDFREDRIDRVLNKSPGDVLKRDWSSGCVVDVTDRMSRIFGRIVDTFSGVDILVNNAGVVVQSPGAWHH